MKMKIMYDEMKGKYYLRGRFLGIWSNYTTEYPVGHGSTNLITEIIYFDTVEEAEKEISKINEEEQRPKGKKLIKAIDTDPKLEYGQNWLMKLFKVQK